jgi:hypothetical protein
LHTHRFARLQNEVGHPHLQLQQPRPTQTSERGTDRRLRT